MSTSILKNTALGLATALLSALPAAAAVDSNSSRNPITVIFFLTFVFVSLAITVWAARRSASSTSAYYTAGGEIKGFQNGLAIAGDYTSAGTFLGVTAMIYVSGYDGLIYMIGFLIGMPMVMLLIAEPLRNLGRYTFGDVVSYRLAERPVRTVAGISTLVIVIVYLISQLVGAGKLIELLFGLSYVSALLIIGGLMTLYVGFGGMLATTWVQIIKAVLLMAGTLIIAFLVMAKFGFSFEALFRKAITVHPVHKAIMAPGSLVSNPVSALSLGLALILGTAGLPHILMRFFTVKDARQARISIFVATGFMAVFYALMFLLGFGAIAVVSGDARFIDEAGKVIGGNNMMVLHLASSLGGPALVGFSAAVAFATILAVVSGVTLAGASAVSHDLYARVVRRGKASEKEEVLVSKIAVVGISIVAIMLSLVFENQNITFIIGLVFAIAASANFPILFLSITWGGLTTRGAVAGAGVGLLASLSMVVLSPAIWTQILHLKGAAPVPYDNPALFSVPLAFVVAWLVSVLDGSASGAAERAAFPSQFVRSQTGFHIETAALKN